MLKIKILVSIKTITLIVTLFLFTSIPGYAQNIQYGVRPFYLIDAMKDGPLKSKLQSCASNTPKSTSFSIAHRGAPLEFPEHTVQSNKAAALMGAGIFECDVTFTKDKQLVCRHAQDDLQATTNILLTNLHEKYPHKYKVVPKIKCKKYCLSIIFDLLNLIFLSSKYNKFVLSKSVITIFS